MSPAASPPGALRPPHTQNSGDVCEASPSAHSQTESSVVASVQSGNQAAAAAAVAHPASSMSRTLEKYQPGASFFSAPEVTLTTAAQPGSKGDVADEAHGAPQRIGWRQRARNTVEVRAKQQAHARLTRFPSTHVSLTSFRPASCAGRARGGCTRGNGARALCSSVGLCCDDRQGLHVHACIWCFAPVRASAGELG